ncbi:cob(I)yrinic acid a,c-diamide adenosyltransferase [Aliidongia dinghuensis]|uniref:Corrinoid adenosyltransferase n=1 Tax=Aliidongia dinghuensis TaxID=1867774 RepID=A0A8J2YQS4_9PROT|nr:cob(I)yrinic acid a,c-diamide adenosyltransferase [Aliidongia dinghuensis]GGF06024.1 cob(I)yrinic acid a,c-diamide adenosyltransferase [Aliidongia dinghuensis]
MTETPEDFARADEKSKKRKEARDKIMATKTETKGLLMVHTGKGKGKSTAAFGVAFRALGHGMRVGIVQFVKGKWESGERAAFAKFGDQVTIHAHGEGFTWETQNRALDIASARAAWDLAVGMIEAARNEGAYDLLVFDELNIALRYDHLPVDEIVSVLQGRPEGLHIIVTGRNAKPELIEAADLVTEMEAVKHPFAAGIKAQKGIEF